MLAGIAYACIINFIYWAGVREGSPHKLPLLLPDGKPNYCDLLEGRSGIEDTSQAVTEARLQGTSPFCLTVDW